MKPGDYLRCVETLLAIHEEIGKLQQRFNDMAWRSKGSFTTVLEGLKGIQEKVSEFDDFAQRIMDKSREERHARDKPKDGK